MLPPEIRRELDRLADEVEASRARLARIRERLAALRTPVDTGDNLRRPDDDTPDAEPVQGLGG
jgi:uncharacterized membrane protein